MYSKQSMPNNDANIDYPITDSNLPFSTYIEKTRAIIEARRPDLSPSFSQASALIVEANCPYELRPSSDHKFKYGVLLIHGLLDCPFSLRDIGEQLQLKGMLCRSILLPGHGTLPGDLLTVSYEDWLQAVRYGIATLKKEVENIYLIGYSTGATLSIHAALQDAHIAGVILLAPAIKLKAPVDIVMGWHSFTQLFRGPKQWVWIDKEVDYAKYQSIGYNPVVEVNALAHATKELAKYHKLSCPIFMAVSHEDETISSHHAIDFFSNLHHPKSRLLLYTSHNNLYPDSRIHTRHATYPALRIRHFSHVAIPFSPNNSHYGQKGDYLHAAKLNADFVYGAYNRIEITLFDCLYRLNITKFKRHELTYNPDFDFMAEKIIEFIQSDS